MPRASTALVGVPSGEREHDANDNSKSLDDREWRFEYCLARVGPVVVNCDHVADDVPTALPVHSRHSFVRPDPASNIGCGGHRVRIAHVKSPLAQRDVPRASVRDPDRIVAEIDAK
jgi:hypothetical protein